MAIRNGYRWLQKPPTGTGLDLSSPLVSGLVGAWAFADDGGNLLLDSAGGYNGTLNTGTSAWSASPLGSAYAFPGSQYFECGTQAALNLTGPMTVALGFAPGSNATKIYSCSSSATVGNAAFVTIRPASSNLLNFAWANFSLNGTTALTLNKWVQAAGVRSGSSGAWTANVYLNGNLDGTTTTATNPSGGSYTTRIGWTPTASFFNGSLAYFYLWNRALSAGEIASVAENPWRAFAPPSVRRFWIPSGGGTAYTLTASAGSYALTGEAATLSAGRKLAAVAGSYALTGQAATLKAGRKLTAAAGSYALTGQAATLATGSAGHYTLVASAGLYTLTGQSATLRAARRLVAATGQYTLTGLPATLAWSGATTSVAPARMPVYWVSVPTSPTPWNDTPGKPTYWTDSP